MARASATKMNSRFDQGLIIRGCGVVAGVMFLGLMGASALAQTPILLEEAKRLASDGAAGDEFGFTVAISGEVAIVGAIFDDDNGVDSGSAYVYRFDGISWAQEQKLLASDGAAFDFFGFSVGISAEAAIVGALFGDGLVLNSGSAYVYRFDGITWVEEGKLLASDGALDDFGFSVAISGDVVIVGARLDDDNGGNSGSAYVFDLGILRAINLLLDLIDTVIDLNLQQGISNSLDAKLDAVIRALQDVNENNDVAAINALQAFINAVQAQSGNHIPVANADALIAQAQALIDLLSAP